MFDVETDGLLESSMEPRLLSRGDFVAATANHQVRPSSMEPRLLSRGDEIAFGGTASINALQWSRGF